MKLGFENIGTEEIQQPEDVEVNWAIYYPAGSAQYRPWSLRIPHLNVGEC